MQYLGLELPEPEEEQSDAFAVWEEHWKALQIFLALRTQWRVVAGLSAFVYQGLDYAAIEPVMNLHGIKKKQRRQIFLELQLIELGAISGLNNGKL